MSLKLETYNTHEEKWWEDVAFDTHQYTEIHNQATM